MQWPTVTGSCDCSQLWLWDPHSQLIVHNHGICDCCNSGWPDWWIAAKQVEGKSHAILNDSDCEMTMMTRFQTITVHQKGWKQSHRMSEWIRNSSVPSWGVQSLERAVIWIAFIGCPSGAPLFSFFIVSFLSYEFPSDNPSFAFASNTISTLSHCEPIKVHDSSCPPLNAFMRHNYVKHSLVVWCQCALHLAHKGVLWLTWLLLCCHRHPPMLPSIAVVILPLEMLHPLTMNICMSAHCNEFAWELNSDFKVNLPLTSVRIDDLHPLKSSFKSE